MSRKQAALLMAGSVLVLAALLLVMGWHAFPLPGDDSGCFIPPAINLKNGLGLINPVDIHAVVTDPGGHFRFMYYPPLFQFVLAALMPEGTAMAAMRALAVLEVLALLATAILLWKRFTASSDAEKNPWAVWTMFFSLVGLMSYLPAGTNGRPEVLVMTWVCLWAGILFFCNCNKWIKTLLVGFFLGLQQATQLISPCFGGLIIAVCFFQTKNFREALIHTTVVALGCGVVFASVLALSPHGILNHLHAINLHRQQMLFVEGESFSFSNFIRMYFTSAHFTGYGFIFISALAAGVLRLVRSQAKTPNRWACRGLLLMLLGAMWVLALRLPPRNYNVFAMMPLFYLVNLDLLISLPALLEKRFVTAGQAFLTVLTAVTGIGFLRKVLLFYFFLAHGVSLEAARADFQKIAPQAHGGSVYVSDALWMLSEDERHLRFWYDRVHPLPPDAGMLLVQNNIYRSSAPPEISGYQIIFNSFGLETPKLLGKQISAYMPGYGFAAYVPTDAQSGSARASVHINIENHSATDAPQQYSEDQPRTAQ